MNVSTGWWLVLGLTVWWVVCMGMQVRPHMIRHYRNADTGPDSLKWIRALVVHLIYWTFLPQMWGADGRRLARPFHSEALCTCRRFCRISLIRAGGCTWNGK